MTGLLEANSAAFRADYPRTLKFFARPGHAIASRRLVGGSDDYVLPWQYL